MTNKKRASNFELLRILCMLMIIMFHAAYKGGFNQNGVVLNDLFLRLFWFLGELGVNVFILISGYFMINSKFRPQKCILILLEMWFYNLISFFIILKKYIISEIKIGAYLFPLTNNTYWFITCYLIIYSLSPFFNYFIKQMSKKQHFELLCILLAVNSVLTTFMGFFYKSPEDFSFYNRLIWLVTVYFFGSYIRLYGFHLLSSLKNSVKLFVVSNLVLIASFVLFVFINYFFGASVEPAYFWTPNSILMFMSSVGLFGIGKNINIQENRIINCISSTTLGTYLIHDGLLADTLWCNIRNIQIIKDAEYSFVYVIIACVLIFIACVVVDLIRQIIEKYTVGRLLNSNIASKVYQKARKIFTQIESRIISENNNMID